MYLAFSKTLQKGVELSEPQCLKGLEEFQPAQAWKDLEPRSRGEAAWAYM